MVPIPCTLVRGEADVPKGRTWPCRTPSCHPCYVSPTGDGEGEEEEEEEQEEKEAKQSHAQRKLKAFGLQVKLFFLTM